MPAILQTYNNAEGVYLVLTGLANTTARVVVTLTDTSTVGAGTAGATNFIHYMAVGQTVTEFQVPITTALSAEYTLSIEGRNSANVAIADNSQTVKFTYVPPPAAFTLPTIGTADQTVVYTIGTLAADITHLQFYLTQMSGDKKPCSITVAAADCTGATVTIDGATAKVAGQTVGTTIHPGFDLINGDVLETTVVAMNASGSSAGNTTTSVTPSADANAPSALALATGSALVALGTDPSDQKMAVTFTPGNQIAEYLDTDYVIHVDSLYKKIALASFTAIDVDGTDVDNLRIILEDTSAGWTTLVTGVPIAGGAGAAQALTLTDGVAYAVQVKAKNGNIVNGTGYSAETAAVSGTPSGVPTAPTFTLATGGSVAEQTIQLTIGGDLTSTAVDNGSDMVSYAVTIANKVQTFAIGDIDSNIINITLVETGGANLANGTQYTIALTATNANGTTAAAATANATPSGLPLALAFVAGTTGPDLNEMASVVGTASGAVKLTWTGIDGAGTPAAYGGLDATTVTYQYQISANADFSSPVADVTDTENNINTATKTGLTNGTSYYARIRATNTNGSGPWTEYGAPVVPSAVPNFANSDINTALLNSFMTNQYVGDNGVFTMNMDDIDAGTAGAALNNITYNGGYAINKIGFVVYNGDTVDQAGKNTVKTALLDITTGTVTFDSGNGNPDALNTGQGGYTYKCNMHLMNAAYTNIVASDEYIESDVKLTNNKSTTVEASATTGDGTMTFSFNQAQDNAVPNTLITGFSVQLQESHAVQLNGATEITWSAYADTGNPNVVTYNASNGTGTAYTTTFAGTNGVRYRAQVTTTSEQPLKSSQANLADVVSPGAVASSAGNMPFGSPIITPTDGSTTSQVSFSVKPNGRLLEDAVMLYGGVGDNYYAFTITLLASTRNAALNGGATYGVGQAGVYAPFNTYQKLDAQGAALGDPTSFNYIATDQACEVGRKYLTLFSGEDGHYSVSSSHTGAMNFLNGN